MERLKQGKVLTIPDGPVFVEWLLAITALSCFGLLAWGCLCLFPIHAWNDIRLRPSFLIADGQPLYPGLNHGLITTWMYGPAHPVWFYPVTWLKDAGTVYLAAAGWNIVGLVLSVAAVCFSWPGQEGENPRGRWLVFGVCLLLIPGAYMMFLQSDNIVLVCGLLSLTCLARHVATPSTATLWLASLFAATAAFAKAHGVAVIAGECVGMALLHGYRQAWPLVWRTLIACVAWSLATLSLSGTPAAVWEHLVLLPGSLPWQDDMLQRTLGLKFELALMVGLPGALILALIKRRLLGRMESVPVLVWLCSIPLGLAGAYKTGGSSNSLHGVFFLLPVIVGLMRRSSMPRHWRMALALAVIGINLIPVWRALSSQPLTPALARIKQAAYLAKGLDRSLWLPWRPLVVYLTTGRHDHDEDGLYVRQVTGYFPTSRQVTAHLPPHWRVTATEYPGMHWGISTAMLPEGTRSELIEGWLFYTMPDNPAGVDGFVSGKHE